MRRLIQLLTTALLGLSLPACDESPHPLAPGLPPPPGAGTGHADLPLFDDAAHIAWSYIERQYQPATGLVNSVAGYPYTTMWDVASGLAALFCAHELGLLPKADYDERTARALATLRTMPLSDGAAFNKNYSTETGAMAGLTDRDPPPPARGVGWSATDLGRLLVWLRIVADAHPQHRAAAEAIVARLDVSRIVRDGYLWGAGVIPDGSLATGVEGRIGYEQYAAYGFALWRHPAEGALQLDRNSLPIAIWDVPLLADRRGDDPLTSEPFVLMGLELGWSPDFGDLARNVLRVQEERYRRTGLITVMSEDAVPVAPHYFYYYSVNFHGANFVAVSPDPHEVLDWPRWVSTKAAFAWHALIPSPYTRLAVDSLRDAADPATGWASGVIEGTTTSIGGANLNTAAVVLQAALYARWGRPLAYGRG